MSMFWKRKKSTLSLLFLLTLIVFSFTVRSIMFWDNLFLMGLVCFLFGGTLLLLRKGVFKNMIHSFSVFMKHSSKLQMYVSEKDTSIGGKTRASNDFIIAYYLLAGGILLIANSTIVSLLLA